MNERFSSDPPSGNIADWFTDRIENYNNLFEDIIKSDKSVNEDRNIEQLHK